MSYGGEMFRSELSSDELNWSFGRIIEGAWPSDEDLLYEMLDSIDGVKEGEPEFLLCVEGESLDVTAAVTECALDSLKGLLKSRTSF